MNLSEYLKKAFVSGTNYPMMEFREGDKQRFRIEMKNQMLDQRGDAVKSYDLVSTYTRTITDIPYSFLALTDIDIQTVEFTPKQGHKPIRWTFAEGLKLPHFIYCCQYFDEYDAASFEYREETGLIRMQNNRFNEAFRKFPKLPSTSLFIIQAYDIGAFDFITSYICSKPILFDKPGKVMEIQLCTFTKCDIGMGIYSENSFFKNGVFYAVFHGYSVVHGKACNVVEYFCDNSKVVVYDESKNFERKREGNSYYSGYVYFDVDTGMPIMGTMLESYMAVQSKIGVPNDTGVPIHIRRRIKMELLEDEEGEP